MREPLLLPAAALASGVAAARFWDFRAPELLFAITGLLVLSALALARRSRRVAGFGCLSALSLAGALSSLAHHPGPPPELDAGFREILIFSGCVVSPPSLSEDRLQFVLELAPGARARVNYYLEEGREPPKLRYGQSIEIEGRARRPHNYGNPGAFDQAGYLARRDIYWLVSARSGTPVRILEDCGSPWHDLLFRLRAATLERIEGLYSDSPYRKALMGAILIGESSRLERVWTDDYRRTGTYHALVVSGLQVTMLAGLLLFLLRLCFCPESLALALASLTACLYALVSGWDAPVARAAVGFILFAAARYFYRRVRVLNLLAAIVIGVLVTDPEQLFEASFQLTFLAVGAIGAIAIPLLECTTSPLARGLKMLADVRRDPKLPPRVAHFRLELRLLAETVFLCTRLPRRWALPLIAAPLAVFFFFFELFVVSAAVQVGLALPMAIYFHRLSVSGLSANLLVSPALSLAVPVGFLAVFTSWSLPKWIAGWLIDFSRVVTRWHADWEPDWRIPDPPVWLALAFAAALLALALTWRRSRSMVIWAGATVAVLLVMLVWHPFPPKVEPGKLELTAIDVGQGESLFLAFPGGKLLVVDGGGFPAIGRRRPQLDIGEDVVSPYLWSRSIRRIDALALTHAHEDHMGGVGALLDNFLPNELWIGGMAETPAWVELRKKALRRGIRIVPLRMGQQFEWGGARVEALAPAPDYATGISAHNNDSLVLRLAFGNHAVLLTGDIQQQVESRLLESGLVGSNDLLKVAHHGSRTSTSPGFLDLARPAFAVISAGFENMYGLPNPELLKRLETRHMAIFRTDLMGLVTIRTDGRRFETDTHRWTEQRPVLYSVFAPE